MTEQEKLKRLVAEGLLDHAHEWEFVEGPGEGWGADHWACKAKDCLVGPQQGKDGKEPTIDSPYHDARVVYGPDGLWERWMKHPEFEDWESVFLRDGEYLDLLNPTTLTDLIVEAIGGKEEGGRPKVEIVNPPKLSHPCHHGQDCAVCGPAKNLLDELTKEEEDDGSK